MGNGSRKKKLPIGIENFEKIRREDFYYVDKTAMIRDLLYKWGEVNLFTRPRRFGKSLNMSMLKSFFEIGCDKSLFETLEIAKEKDLCQKYMGNFPVISISLKSINANNYVSARAMICAAIGSEAMRFQFILESDLLTDKEKNLYHQLTTIDQTNQEVFTMSDSVLTGSLKTLSNLLEKFYDRKTIILIDEYDVPLAKAYENGYYKPMAMLIRNIFDQAFKTNDSLYFAVLTGCLRVAKESIFTGLNNLKTFSVTTVRFDEYFGFTDEEVKEMLEYYELDNRYIEIKNWYNGYHFGNAEVYCPWDVISYCDELMDDPSMEPKDYWSNTSNNDVIRHFIKKLDNGLTKSELEALLAGETVVREIYEDLTYNRLYDTIDHLWSVLLTTGYLTQRGKMDRNKYYLSIPNMEIRSIFTEQIMALFKEETNTGGKTMKIVVLDGFTLNPGDISWEGLEALGEVTVYERTRPEDIIARIGDAQAVYTNKTPLTRDVFDACANLRFVGVLATGYNVVDIKAAKEKKIAVTNIPTYGTAAVAQFAIALLLELCHHIGEHSASVLRGEWSRSQDWCYWNYPLVELAGKTMGIIGFGRIGQETGRIAQALGMKVLAYDEVKYPDRENETCHYTDLDTLLCESDVISLHCPLFPATQGMINRKTIARMKTGVLLINCSRGPLVVEEDLSEALNSGKVAGAALDVVSTEPIREDNPLLAAKNVIITPHIAWAPKESRIRLMQIAVDNLRCFIEGRPQNVVNL